MSDDDDDDVPRLAPDTLAILQEFLDQGSKDDAEDWQLSQFWYDEETTTTLCEAIYKLCRRNSKVALLSCPTLCQRLIDKKVLTTLLEYDRRFEKFGEQFVFYDYRKPLDIEPRLHHYFDIVVADPPFLSEECLTKALQTVNLLKKNDRCKLIVCTGAVMADLALKLANIKPCSFLPKHRNNLANEFRCYTNFGELPE